MLHCRASAAHCPDMESQFTFSGTSNHITMPSLPSTSLTASNKAKQHGFTRSISLRSRWRIVSSILASAVVIILAVILLSAYLRRRRRRLHTTQLKQHISSPCLNRASTMTHCRAHSNFSWPIPRTGQTVFRDEGEEGQEHARSSPRNRSIESLSDSAVVHPEPAVHSQLQPQLQRTRTDSFAVSAYTHSRTASCVSIGTTMSDRDIRRKGYEGWPGGEPLLPVVLPPVILPELPGGRSRSIDEGKKR